MYNIILKIIVAGKLRSSVLLVFLFIALILIQVLGQIGLGLCQLHPHMLLHGFQSPLLCDHPLKGYTYVSYVTIHLRGTLMLAM